MDLKIGVRNTRIKWDVSKYLHTQTIFLSNKSWFKIDLLVVQGISAYYYKIITNISKKNLQNKPLKKKP